MFDDDEKCSKCNKKISSHEEIWNNSLCNSCKTTRHNKLVLIFSILVILGGIIGLIGGLIEFNYNVDKCSNLKSSESSYDFDKTVELDANYNENCYFINNHPLALISYIGGGVMIGGMLGLLIGLVLCMTRTMGKLGGI